MKKWVGFAVMALLPLMAACGNKAATDSSATKDSDKLTEVTLVLDYVPNTNHTGIYVAQDKGYYKDAGLKVKIIEPGDNATSIGLVGAGKAQFGLSYQEDVTYAHADDQNIPVKAIATVIQHNTSGFTSLKSANITNPKDFENKTYAGWQAPSEEAVLKAVMTQAGADFSKLKMVGASGAGPENLGKEADIEWYFEGWDVVKAKDAGIALNYMPVRDLDERLDYYTPVIISSDAEIEKNPKVVQAFMDATKKGYQDAIKDPQASAKILSKSLPDYELSFLEESQVFLSANYTDDAANWGVMDKKVWDNYTDFMIEYGLIKSPVKSSALFTNDFIGK